MASHEDIINLDAQCNAIMQQLRIENIHGLLDELSMHHLRIEQENFEQVE